MNQQHTCAVAVLNQTLSFLWLLCPPANRSSTKTSTYYRAPGLAVKELVPVRQIKSGNTEKTHLVLVGDPEYRLIIFSLLC